MKTTVLGVKPEELNGDDVVSYVTYVQIIHSIY